MLTWLYNNDMNKTIIMFFTIAFSLGVSYLPMLMGNYEILSGWSILGGLIGGFFGPATEQALRDYQLANGLPVTGVLDEVTRDLLNSRFLNTDSVNNGELSEGETPSKISGLTATVFDAFGSAIDFVGGKVNVTLFSILILLVIGQLYLWLRISKK